MKYLILSTFIIVSVSASEFCKKDFSSFRLIHVNSSVTAFQSDHDKSTVNLELALRSAVNFNLVQNSIQSNFITSKYSNLGKVYTIFSDSIDSLPLSDDDKKLLKDISFQELRQSNLKNFLFELTFEKLKSLVFKIISKAKVFTSLSVEQSFSNGLDSYIISAVKSIIPVESAIVQFVAPLLSERLVNYKNSNDFEVDRKNSINSLFNFLVKDIVDNNSVPIFVTRHDSGVVVLDFVENILSLPEFNNKLASKCMGFISLGNLIPKGNSTIDNLIASGRFYTLNYQSDTVVQEYKNLVSDQIIGLYGNNIDSGPAHSFEENFSLYHLASFQYTNNLGNETSPQVDLVRTFDTLMNRINSPFVSDIKLSNLRLASQNTFIADIEVDRVNMLSDSLRTIEYFIDLNGDGEAECNSFECADVNIGNPFNKNSRVAMYVIESFEGNVINEYSFGKDFDTIVLNPQQDGSNYIYNVNSNDQFQDMYFSISAPTDSFQATESGVFNYDSTLTAPLKFIALQNGNLKIFQGFPNYIYQGIGFSPFCGQKGYYFTIRDPIISKEVTLESNFMSQNGVNIPSNGIYRGSHFCSGTEILTNYTGSREIINIQDTIIDNTSFNLNTLGNNDILISSIGSGKFVDGKNMIKNSTINSPISISTSVIDNITINSNYTLPSVPGVQIANSSVVNSELILENGDERAITIRNSNVSNGNKIYDGSVVRGADIENSTVKDSQVSGYIRNSEFNSSEFSGVALNTSKISNATVLFSKVDNATVQGSLIDGVNINNYNIVNSSSVIGSGTYGGNSYSIEVDEYEDYIFEVDTYDNILDRSTIDNSSITESTLYRTSIRDNDNISNSTIDSSDVSSDSIVADSYVLDSSLVSARVTNSSEIRSSTINNSSSSNSVITRTNFRNQSSSVDSQISDSSLSNTTVRRSRVIASTAFEESYIDVNVTDGEVTPK